MRHGADWYKREPLAYLGGVQGLTARQHAVYSVVLDLIYVHGGSVNNDPRWIAGWIADMGSSAVRTAIEELVTKGKLCIDGNGDLSQKRAKTEAKTRENLRETARENGKKGGEKSSVSRAAAKENNDIPVAVATPETQADKIREEKRVETIVSTTAPKRAKPKTRIPPEALISERMRAAAIERGLSDAEAEAQFVKFRDWAVAKGQTYADWDAAWRNWLTSPYFAPVLGQVTPFPSKRPKSHGERYSELSEALDARLAERPFGSGDF